jgi:hypothetical protein
MELQLRSQPGTASESMGCPGVRGVFVKLPPHSLVPLSEF